MQTTGWAAFAAVLFWLVPFLAGKQFRLGSSKGRRKWLSMAAGIAIAYIFVDLLPQMSHMQASFAAAAEGKGLPAPEFRVYFSALLGFLTFYAIHTAIAEAGERDLQEGSSALQYVDFLGFAGYCGLMGYLLAVEPGGLLSIALYAVAMFFHLWLVDHSLRREHGDRYDRAGRWIIVFGLLAGWIAGASGLTSDSVVPTMMGFIGGGVVINSVRGELPGTGEGRLLPLVAGALGYALLLIAVELTKGKGHHAAFVR